MSSMLTVIVCMYRIHHFFFVVSPAAFFKHDTQGNYVIQSAKRYRCNDGILSLAEEELDLYSDMCLRSQHLSHEAIFEPDFEIMSSTVKQPHDDHNMSLRDFGQKIFANENIIEVNKFTRRTHKQEFVSEEEGDRRAALKRSYSRKSSSSHYSNDQNDVIKEEDDSVC